MPPPPLSSAFVRLLYVLSWPAIAGSIIIGGVSWWYFENHKSTYFLTDLEKEEVARIKENCVWAGIGWLGVVLLGFIILKALYFVLKGEPTDGDKYLYGRFNENFVVALCLITFSIFYSFVLKNG
jgi:hypothetical protein